MKRKLGRGLHALLGVEMDDAESEALESGDMPAGEFQAIPIADIQPNPFQPRREFDEAELKELCASIEQHGIIQPIAVRKAGEQFELIAGERRWRAAQRAGLTTVPARILDLDDKQIFEVALVENLQRKDLNSIEKAKAFVSYVRKYSSTHEELAGHLGIDRSTVTNLIRLLDLPDEVQTAVQAAKISSGHARALLSLPTAAEQIELCDRIVKEAISVRETERLVREAKPVDPAKAAEPKSEIQAPAKEAEPTGPTKSNHVLSIENEIRQKLGTKIEINLKTTDTGTFVLHFLSNDDFERIVSHLLGKSAQS